MVCVCERERSNVLIYLGEMYRGVHSIGFLKMEIAQSKKLGKILLRKATFGGESAHVNQ